MGVSTIDVRVTSARAQAPDVRELVLEPVDAAPLPRFSAGSHVVVHVPGDRVRRNPYSLACPPWSTRAYRIGVRLLAGGRGGSVGVHERIAVGDVIAIEPPRNLFAPVSYARHHVLVAGGIGITPFVSYAHQLIESGTSYELHYAFREAAGGPFLDELTELCGDALHAYRDPDGSLLMAALDEALADRPIGTHLSTCGPGPMMDAVVALARHHGWPESRIHLERFSLDSGPADPFDVTLAGSDRAVHVGEDVTLLEALEDAGLEIPYMCRQGICGECRTGVLEGTPDHRDIFLTDEEHAAGTVMMPCVSRCAGAGPLVLDLS